MDPDALASTLINAAQSMMSQNQHQYPHPVPPPQQQGFGDFRDSPMQGGGVGQIQGGGGQIQGGGGGGYSQGYGSQMQGGSGWRGNRNDRGGNRNDRRDYGRDDRRNDRRDYRDRSDDRRNDRNDWSRGGNQRGPNRDMYQERSFRGGHRDTKPNGFGAGGIRKEKNYREKIKPENGPPNYRGDDYAHIETELLSCKICKKVMWHNISFAKHIRGRAHQEELEKLVESDNDMIKELREQIKVVESKKDDAGNDENCTMCDVKAAGPIEDHRKSNHHRQLRKFLHPSCEMCVADFDGRSDWYYHSYSAEHLSNLQGFGGNDKSGVLDKKDLGRLVRELGGQQCSDGGSFLKRYNDSRALYLKKLKEQEEEDNIKTLEEKIDPSLPGAGHLMATKGFFCSLCDRFFTKEESSVSFHCNSIGHLDKERAAREEVAQNY